MSRVNRACLAVIVLLVRGVLWAQESDEALLARYLKRGIEPSTVAMNAGYLSEREVLIGVARRLPRLLSAQASSLPPRLRAALPEACMEEPIPVRVFDYGMVERRDSPLYHYVVAIYHPSAGLILLAAYTRHFDRRSEAVSWSLGNGIWPGQRKSRPIYLVTAEEARSLVTRVYGVAAARRPVAVSVAVSNLRVGGMNAAGWFWYVRPDEPIDSAGGKVRSVFVYPVAEVPSMEAVTLDLLAGRESITDAGAVLAKDRFYTWEGADIDLYALDEAQRAAGDVALSRSPQDRLYLPEQIRFVPVVLGSSGPAETE